MRHADGPDPRTETGQGTGQGTGPGSGLEGGIAYVVRYDGLPTPTDRFVDHYETTHAAILKQFPGLRGLTLMTPADWRDPQPVNAGQTDFLAMMTFDDTAALTAALRSPMREQARADFANLPVGDARVTHQAMHIRRVA